GLHERLRGSRPLFRQRHGALRAGAQQVSQAENHSRSRRISAGQASRRDGAAPSQSLHFPGRLCVLALWPSVPRTNRQAAGPVHFRHRVSVQFDGGTSRRFAEAAAQRVGQGKVLLEQRRAPAQARVNASKRLKSEKNMTSETQRIAINCGGGYVPGLNAVVAGTVLSASRLGWEIVGIHDGYDGLLIRDNYPDGGLV